MGKVNVTMLAFNGFIFLLGLICSTTLSLVGYAVAGSWPALAVSPAVAPLAAEAKAMPAPTGQAKPRDELALETQENRIEYYRGIFDVCVFSGRNEAAPEKVFIACHEVVRRAVTQNWFEMPSREWKWPLPAMPSKLEQDG
jgi:hypothetical protein